MSKHIISLGGCQKVINDRFACLHCSYSNSLDCAIYGRKLNKFVREENKKTDRILGKNRRR